MAEFKIYERQMSGVATVFRLNVLKRTGVLAFRLNQAYNTACYKLGWACSLAVNRAVVGCFLRLKGNDREEKSAYSRTVRQLDNYEDRTEDYTVRACSRQAIRPISVPETSEEVRKYDLPLKSIGRPSRPLTLAEPQATASHANTVLYKSEELCQRVSSLMDRISTTKQHKLSIETSSQVPTSRLNLYIPDVQVESPLSPMTTMSMGGLDSDRQLTQRSNKLQNEIRRLERAEKLWNLWKGWKNYVEQRKISHLKHAIAVKTAYNRRARLFLIALKATVRTANYKQECIGLATAFRTTRTTARVLRLLSKSAKKEGIRSKAEQLYTKRAWKRVVKVLYRRAQGKIATNAKLMTHREKLSHRSKAKFFSLLHIQSKILAREGRQKTIAETYDNSKKANLVFRGLSVAVQEGKVQRRKEAKASLCFFRNSGRKHFKIFKVAVKLSAFYHGLLVSATEYYLDTNYRRGFDALAKLRKARTSRKLYAQKATTHYKNRRRAMALRGLRVYTSSLRSYADKIETTVRRRHEHLAIKAISAWSLWAPKRTGLRSANLAWQESKDVQLRQDLFYIWLSRTEDSVARHQDLLYDGVKNSVRRVLRAWRKKAASLIHKRDKEQQRIYKFDVGVARRILSRWRDVSSLKLRHRDEKAEAVAHFTRKHYWKWRALFKKRNVFRRILSRGGKKAAFYTWASFAAQTRKEFKQYKAAILLNSLHLKRSQFKIWLDKTSSNKEAKMKDLTLRSYLKGKEKELKRNALKALFENSTSKQKTKLMKRVAVSHDLSIKLATGFGRWYRKVRYSTARRHLTSKVLKGWKGVSSALAWQNQVVEAFKKQQASMKGFRGLQLAVTKHNLELETKVNQFRLSTGLLRWGQYLEDSKNSYRFMQKMQRKADEFAEVSGLFRGLQKLKQNSDKSSLMKAAQQHCYLLQLRKGVNRWKKFHDRILKPLAKARIATASLKTTQHKNAFKHWNAFAKSSAANRRLEQRKAFYHQRQSARLLLKWNNITSQQAHYRASADKLCTISLKSRVFKGFEVLHQLKSEKAARDLNQCKVIRFHRLRVWLARLHAATSAKRDESKANDLALAYNKQSLVKFGLAALKRGCIAVRKSQRKLPQLFYEYCQKKAIALCKFHETIPILLESSLPSDQKKTIKRSGQEDLPDAVVNTLLNQVKKRWTDPRIDSYSKVLSFNVPISKPATTLGKLFCCWRTAATLSSIVKESRADETNRRQMLKRSLLSWRKLSILAKARSRTISTAVLFHRYKLRHRTMKAIKRLLRKVSFK